MIALAKRVTNWFSRRRGAHSIVCRYDAAQTDDQNYRYWSGADALDADSANTLAIRKKIRERARYEFANSCYLRAQVETRTVHEIRTGPALAVSTDNRNFNGMVETEWRRWCDDINLVEILRTLVRARMIDGEAFAVLTRRRPRPNIDLSAVELAVVPVECDRVTAPDFRMPDSRYIDGVHIDADGTPVAYDILDEHPGSTAIGIPRRYRTWPARYVIHLFRPTRPGQHRGVSELTPALTVLPGVRQYIAACIRARVTSASITLAVKTDLPPEGEAEDVSPGAVDIPYGSMFQLPAGWEVQQIAAQHPDATGRDFVADRIAEAGRALMLPRNLATGDSSDYNFASGRLDHQPYFADIEVAQTRIEQTVLERVFTEWFMEYTLMLRSQRGYDIQSFPPPRHDWLWPGQPYTDPESEANAVATGLKTGATTLVSEYARRGLDYDDQVALQAAAWGIEPEVLKRVHMEAIFPPPKRE
ncbi:MAG TPA: phage portal protein [Bacillota bacterium]|nr:phage portal protein [Bacillota bacterium]